MRVHFHSDMEGFDRPLCPQTPTFGSCSQAPRPLTTCLNCPHSSHAFCGQSSAYQSFEGISPFGLH